jgi:hypothetical protein
MGSRRRVPLNSSPAYKRGDLTMRKLQSAMTNGRVIYRCDQRLPWMRRLRDCVFATLNDAGGPENVSHAERVLAGRCAMLTVQLEQIEQKFAEQNGIATSEQLHDYMRMINALRRAFVVLSAGLPRRAKDVTPSPLDYAQETAE